MNVRITTLAMLLMAVTATQSVGQKGTVFGEVEWANTNLGQPGFFAVEPDMYTEFYRWNYNVAFSTISGSYWTVFGPPSPTWEDDPCPTGWRLPTWDDYRELDTISDVHSLPGYPSQSSGTWAAANERGNKVAGRFFGFNHATCELPNNMDGCIFIAANGFRYQDVNHLGTLAYYRTNTTIPNPNHNPPLSVARNPFIPIVTYFSQNWVTYTASINTPELGATIRCVRDAQTTINDIRWAKTNLSTSGTFAERPDMYTEFYQWNRDTAWATTGKVIGWNGTNIVDPEWTANPCPTDWRLPTQEEFTALQNTGSSWAAAGSAKGNLVAGRFYGANHADCSLPDNMEGCIFLPAGGNRGNGGGMLVQGAEGSYWSSTQANNTLRGRVLTINSAASNNNLAVAKSSGRNIRCVYDPATPRTNTFSLTRRANSGSDAVENLFVKTEADLVYERLYGSNSPVSETAHVNPKIYPNPVTNGQLIIDNGELAIGVVEVLNNSGAVVRTQDFGSQTTGTLQLQGLQGTYFVKVGSNMQSVVVAR